MLVENDFKTLNKLMDTQIKVFNDKLSPSFYMYEENMINLYKDLYNNKLTINQVVKSYCFALKHLSNKYHDLEDFDGFEHLYHYAYARPMYNYNITDEDVAFIHINNFSKFFKYFKEVGVIDGINIDFKKNDDSTGYLMYANGIIKNVTCFSILYSIYITVRDLNNIETI